MPKIAGKPRARMTAYAAYQQACRESLKKAQPNQPIDFKDFSQRCAAGWKVLTEEQKKPYEEVSNRDKIRFDNEMMNYEPPAGEGRSSKRKAKDPNAPKRPLSGFFLFSNDQRPIVRNQNPEFKITDIARELGRMWREADPQVKNHYQTLAAENKAVYEKNLKALGNSSKKAKVDAQQHPTREYEDDEESEEESDG